MSHVDEAAIAAVVDVLRSGQLVHGKHGVAFEAELQRWLGCKHTVLVSSGTAALHLALVALNIGPGDAVLVPDFTFPATANVVLLTGATPVLLDVDAQSYCLTPLALEAAIAAWRGPEQLRAIMPVHEFGHPVDMTAVRAIAQRHRLKIIEDAACAIGASESGAMVGTQGDVGCFSLHPRKTLTTGEGGILATNDSALAQRLRRLRSHGMERSPAGSTFYEAGFNYRLTDMQSAMGRTQLPQLAAWITSRRALAEAYREALGPLAHSGRLTLPADHAGHSWQTFMVVLADDFDRTAVIGALADQGIEANLGAQCVSSEPAFAAFVPAGGSPVAQRLCRQGLALPFCEQYGAADVARVAGALASVLQASHDR
jgi:dTDP-4-amino-4,6-dideoxygalactose transaminase